MDEDSSGKDGNGAAGLRRAIEALVEDRVQLERFIAPRFSMHERILLRSAWSDAMKNEIGESPGLSFMAVVRRPVVTEAWAAALKQANDRLRCAIRSLRPEIARDIPEPASTGAGSAPNR